MPIRTLYLGTSGPAYPEKTGGHVTRDGGRALGHGVSPIAAPEVPPMPVVRLVLAAAVGAVLAPPLATLPATAGPTPDGCAAARLSASAGADLLRVQALDPRAVHLPGSPV